MAALRAKLDALQTTISVCATEARLYEIPTYNGTEVPDTIEPNRYTGEEALSYALRAIAGMSRLEDQHPATACRNPGVIIVDKDLTPAIESVNQTKDALRDYLRTHIKDSRARRHFTQTEFRGRVMLQVYRHIYCNARSKNKDKPKSKKETLTTLPIHKIAFTWSPYTESTKTLTKAMALQLLSKRAESKIDTLIPNRQIALNMATQYVQSCKHSTVFAIIKPRSPFPKANLFYNGGKIVDVPASVPLVIYSAPGTAPKIQDIPDYDKDRRKSTRGDKHNHVLIHQPLYLYQKS